MTIAKFITSAGITMTVKQADDNPDMDSQSRDTMDHWKCLLRSGKSQMTVHFSMGSGHGGAKPNLPNVLDCLASDAAGIANARSFEDWCSETLLWNIDRQ